MPLGFGILGALDVHDGGRRITVGSAQQRAVLGVLLLHANEVVSTGRLIDAIWGDRPPRTADKALQVHISQLRRLLDPDRPPSIRTRPRGYLLQVDDEHLDLARFERARAAAARVSAAAERARILREALALWRGPALADVEPTEALRGDLARLEAMRLATLESRIAADLAAGAHAEVVPELETLVARHPLREPFRADLMLALYRSGRQADALRVYADGRSALVEELGVEPGRQLRELHTKILAQDVSLDRPADARPAVLVGRDREMTALRPLVEAAVAGSGAVLLLTGEAGIGKSYLAEALTEHAVARGAVAGVGRCWEAGGAPTYGPWVQAISACLDEFDPDLLGPLPAGDAAVLAGLLPDLADDRSPATDEASRFRLFSAVSRLLRRVAANRPLVLWLDDLHAADDGSLHLLRHLTADVGRSSILIIGTYRDADLTAEHAGLSTELTRERAVHLTPLAGLSVTDTVRLLELTAGRPVPADVAAPTEGNPLFTVEVGRLFAVDGHRPQALPRGILDVIAQRLGRRSEACREVLALASVIGREFDTDTLLEVSPLDEDDLFIALDEGIAAGLVGDVAGTPGRLRFSHMMVRDALYDALTPHRRLRLHRQVGDGLEAVHGRGGGQHVAELAHHYLRAGRLSADKAIDYATLAGDRAAEQFSHHEAAVHYAAALRALRSVEVGDRMRECTLLLKVGDALSRSGDTPGARSPLREAARIAQAHGWPDLLARAVLGYGGRLAWARACTDPALTPLLETALAAVHDEDRGARVRLLARLAAAKRDDRRRDERIALATEALGIADRTGDPGTAAIAAEGSLIAAEGPDGVEERRVLAERIITLGTRAADVEIVYAGHHHRLMTLLTLADRAAVEAEAPVVAALTAELRQPAQQWQHHTFLTTIALLEGRFAEAERLIAATAELGRGPMSWNATVSATMQLLVLRRAQGRLAELEQAMREAVHRYPTLLRFRCALAHLHARLQQTDAVRAAFDDVLPSVLAGDHVDAEWLVAVALLPDACAFLDDAAAASRLYSLLLPYRHLYATAPGEMTFGSMERALGVLAATAGRIDPAVDHLTAALATEQRMRALPWLALARHDLAGVLLRRGAPGDRERAADLRRAATALDRDLRVAP